MKRHIQIDDWDFEVVQVRARKTPAYGQPYTCVVTINLLDDTCFMDGMLDKDSENFNKADSETFVKFGQAMEAQSIDYTRYHYNNNQTHKRKVSINI
jgi:hypothetical protein